MLNVPTKSHCHRDLVYRIAFTKSLGHGTPGWESQMWEGPMCLGQGTASRLWGFVCKGRGLQQGAVAECSLTLF